MLYPHAPVSLMTILFLALSLVSACYIVVPSQVDIPSHGRRLRHRSTSEKFAVPHKSSSPLYRIRYAKNTVFLKRRRRNAAKSRHRRYTYGIVPFMLDPDLSPKQRTIAKQTMSFVENSTCIRFVDRILDNGQLARDFYRLGHNGYIEFIGNDECYSSALGNIRTRTRVSCCNRRIECLRVLGKALGRVEQQDYRNDGTFPVDPNLISFGRRGRYLKALQWEVLDQILFGHSQPSNDVYGADVSTPMTLLRASLNAETTAQFYFFQEISKLHQCHINNCSDFKMNCSNDGYITLVNGLCTCRCPDGLDPKTGCSTVAKPTIDDVDCGGVFQLNKENSSISFTSTPARNLTCTWLVMAPMQDTIIFDYDLFNIATSFGECEDRLEVRYSKIGKHGKDQCGRESPNSITSHFNRLLVRLFTSSGPDFRSSFKATARLLSRDNMCYNPLDKGYTYAGTIDYAHDYSPCAPWWQVTHCQHHPYRFQDLNARLDNNFCRNPNNGLRPWCYINPRKCQRKYCDVCSLERPHNVLKDCYHLINSNSTYCTQDKQTARATCAKECRHDLFDPPENVSRVRCGKPEVPADGYQLDKLGRPSFGVGEYVTFRCRHLNRLYRTTLRKYCLTSGEWSHGKSTCLPCHLNKGWVLHGESCYSISIKKKSAEEQQMRCRRHGGDLVDVSSWEEQKFITGLALSKGVRNYYIGANDKHTEGKFFFRSFAAVSWTNWDPHSINVQGIDCVVVNVEGIWRHERCHRKYRAVCRAPILQHRHFMGNPCIDFRDDCTIMAELDAKMCDREDGMFAVTQCAKTCGVC